MSTSPCAAAVSSSPGKYHSTFSMDSRSPGLPHRHASRSQHSGADPDVTRAVATEFGESTRVLTRVYSAFSRMSIACSYSSFCSVPRKEAN